MESAVPLFFITIKDEQPPCTVHRSVDYVHRQVLLRHPPIVLLSNVFIQFILIRQVDLPLHGTGDHP